MSKYEIEVAVDGFHYLEGPRWYQSALWFVDFYTQGVYRVNDEGVAEKMMVTWSFTLIFGSIAVVMQMIWWFQPMVMLMSATLVLI